MTSSNLHRKLNPNRYPNMSPTMGAIMGYIPEREYTTPVLADVMVTTDGSVIGWLADAAGGLGHSLHIGHIVDFRTVSRPFPVPKDGNKVAVKVINHYGDEVLKVFAV